MPLACNVLSLYDVRDVFPSLLCMYMRVNMFSWKSSVYLGGAPTRKRYFNFIPPHILADTIVSVFLLLLVKFEFTSVSKFVNIDCGGYKPWINHSYIPKNLLLYISIRFNFLHLLYIQ